VHNTPSPPLTAAQELIDKFEELLKLRRAQSTLLGNSNVRLLQAVCTRHGLDTTGFKKDLVIRLEAWVSYTADLRCQSERF
jgi:hypothetical protein